MEPVEELEVGLETQRLIHLLPYTQRCRLKWSDKGFLGCVERTGLG